MVASWLMGAYESVTGQRSNNGSGGLADTLLMAYISDEERRHVERIRHRWEIYRGQHPRSLRVRLNADGTRGPDDNVTINYSRDIVDTGVAFLYGDDCEFQIPDDEGKSDREAWLEDCWQANRKITTLQKHALNGAIAGHAFLRLYPADQARYGHEYPRIVILDPATVWPTWDDDDIDIVTRYRIQYNTIDQQTGKPVIKRQIIALDQGGWTITDQATTQYSNTFETLDEARWPYPWSPISHTQNLPLPNEFWGMSDLEDDTLQLQYAVNFAASNNQKIIRNHAHPKTYTTGVAQGTALDMSPDTTVVLPSGSTLGQLEMQGDLSASLNHLKWLAQQQVTLNRVPEIALGMTDEPGNLSGVALTIKFKPLLSKTAQKQALQADLLREINMHLFDLAGQGEDVRTVVVWPNPLPQDDKAERESAVIDEQLGVSKETLLTKLGYDPEVEAQRKQDEQSQNTNIGAALLQTFMRGNQPVEQMPPGQQQASPMNQQVAGAVDNTGR